MADAVNRNALRITVVLQGTKWVHDTVNQQGTNPQNSNRLANQNTPSSESPLPKGAWAVHQRCVFNLPICIFPIWNF